MYTNSLTLPFLPDPRRTESSEPWQWLRNSLRLPSFSRTGSLPQTTIGEQQSDGLSTRRTERRLSKIAQRGQQIELGTLELPYDPLAIGSAPLAALRRFDGLTITITTRSSEILEQLDLLVELDQRHAVAVDILVASLEPDASDLAERLRTVSALSSHGITTRLVLTDLPNLPRAEETDRTEDAPAEPAAVRRLFEAAKEYQAFDVAAAFAPGDETEQWSRALRYLRLELGFPRGISGRG